MIATGVYEPAAPGATTLQEATPLLDRAGLQVRATVQADTRQVTIWHGRMVRWAGLLPDFVQLPVDLFRWLQDANR